MQRIQAYFSMGIGITISLYLLLNGIYFYRLGGFQGNYPLSTTLGHLVFALVCLLLFLFIYLRKKFNNLERQIIIRKYSKIKKPLKKPLLKLSNKRHTI
jgi:hypothetical protein